jgi:undecaprenyl-diphosphatase
MWAALALGLAVAFALDQPITTALRPLHDSGFTHLLRATVRWLGTGYVQAALLLILLAVGAARSRRLVRAAGLGLLAGALSGIFATVLKVLVHRPRPDAVAPLAGSWLRHLHLAMHQGGLRSFPSGESTTTFAIAWMLGASFPKWRAALLSLAALVSVARVLVGSHHLSDIWAGAMLGIAVAQWVVARWRPREAQGPRAPE